MPQAMYDCVDRKRFDARLADVTRKAKKRLAVSLARTKTGPEGFANYAGDVIRENAWLTILAQVSSVKPHVTVDDIQIFAVGQVLRLANNHHADRDQLSAWADIVELTKLGSLLTSK